MYQYVIGKWTVLSEIYDVMLCDSTYNKLVIEKFATIRVYNNISNIDTIDIVIFEPYYIVSW